MTGEINTGAAWPKTMLAGVAVGGGVLVRGALVGLGSARVGDGVGLGGLEVAVRVGVGLFVGRCVGVADGVGVDVERNANRGTRKCCAVWYTSSHGT